MKKKSSNTKGVRYREHESRNHGKQKDKYFFIRYKLGGKTKEEGLGWASEGWTEKKSAEYLFELKKNGRTGEGPKTMAEKRKTANENKTLQEEKIEATFLEIFEKYIAQAKHDKSKKSCRNEIGMFNTWITTVLGNKTLTEINVDLLEEIKKSINKAGRTPRTAHYVLAVIRQVFNYAKNRDLYSGDNPVNKIKKPSNDNRRIRFLTKKEVEILLEHLRKSSEQVYGMSLLSLHCGLRAGEIFNLTWNDVDFEHGILSIKDTKSGRNRSAIMTKDVRKILEDRNNQFKSNGYVFSSTSGGKIAEISNTFSRAVESLGFNEGITDERHKVVFHTLRHTYASWLVMSGVDLYTVQRLMGHSTISMTERYSHLAPDHLKKAVRMFEANLCS